MVQSDATGRASTDDLSDKSGVPASAANGEEIEVVHDEMAPRKQALEHICVVLGVNYNAKLAEFGSNLTAQRVDLMISFLRLTRDDNFRQLKQISKDIIEEWKLSDTPLKRMDKFSWILYIKDADIADDLSAKNLLSTSWVKQAKEELASLKKARHDHIWEKYDLKRKKLNGMLEGAHLVAKDVGFDPQKQVAEKDYKSERENLKRFIKLVKIKAAKRKELVLRVELAKDAVKKATKATKLNWDLQYVMDLIGNARDLAQALEKEEDVIPYEGRNVHDILTELEDHVLQAFATLESEKRKKEKAALADRTRKGTRYRKRDDSSEEDRADEAIDVLSDSEADVQS